MKHIIELRPARTSPRGYDRPADYLHCFIYPPLLSGRPVEVGVTRRPEEAQRFEERDLLESAMSLLASINYTGHRAIPVEDTHPCGCPASVVTSVFRSGEQCSSCGTTWDHDEKITTNRKA